MAEEANNMDLDMETLDKINDLDLEGLKDTIDGAGARERLLQMIEDGELSEDARESLRAMLAENTPLFAGYGVLVALGFATLTFSVIFFFGYKLYKSIRDKEKKKEEKKKAKQQKKKK